MNEYCIRIYPDEAAKFFEYEAYARRISDAVFAALRKFEVLTESESAYDPRIEAWLVTTRIPRKTTKCWRTL